MQEVDTYLEQDIPSDLRGDALAFRSSLHEDAGDWDAAVADLTAALPLADSAYQRYSIELTLGRLYEEAGETLEASKWYLTALETTNESGTTSAGTALLRLLNVKAEEALSTVERALATQGVTHSWELLQIEGDPELTDLKKAAELLVDAQSRPMPS